MAWVEDETWAMEQGIDASLEFELFSDDAQTTPWPFTGWDVNATVSDLKGRTVYPVTANTTPATGKIKLIFPESSVHNLKPNRTYRWDCLMVAPGNNPADDHHLATGPVTVALRSSRRDAP